MSGNTGGSTNRSVQTIDNDDRRNDAEEEDDTEQWQQPQQQQQEQPNYHQSSLTLLEHVNLNVPSHREQDRKKVLAFYFDVLGCGVDPRIAMNLHDETNDDADEKEDPDTTKAQADEPHFAIEPGLIWPNCGVSQFHLPRADVAQTIPGHIGLRYHSLQGIKARVIALDNNNSNDDADASSSCCFSSYTLHPANVTTGKQEYLVIEDTYGNLFQCREEEVQEGGVFDGGKFANIQSQPLVYHHQTDEFGDVARKYGIRDGRVNGSNNNNDTDDRESDSDAAKLPVAGLMGGSDCRGIDYVELHCRPGTATKIAQFYEVILDATTSVITDPNGGGERVALIALGRINLATGRAEQYLIYRETSTTPPVQEYDGHHIAVYVGTTMDDFVEAFQKAHVAELVWVNPRFVDTVTTLEHAVELHQFRLKDIIDLDTGIPLLEFEHEIRSIHHPNFPGWKRDDKNQGTI